MKNIIAMILLGMVIGASSPLASGDHHGQVPPGDGAFAVLWLKHLILTLIFRCLKITQLPLRQLAQLLPEHRHKDRRRLSWPDVHMERLDSMEQAMAANDKYDANKATAELLRSGK